MKTLRIIGIAIGSSVWAASCIATVGLIGLVIIVNLVSYAISPESYAEEYRDKLPNDAEETQEHIVDLFPDWDYYLKAKITKEEFDKFVKDLELTHNPIRGEATIPIKGPDWWNPKLKGLTYSRIYKDKQDITWGYASAVYEDGYVYLFV